MTKLMMRKILAIKVPNFQISCETFQLETIFLLNYKAKNPCKKLFSAAGKSK